MGEFVSAKAALHAVHLINGTSLHGQLIACYTPSDTDAGDNGSCFPHTPEKPRTVHCAGTSVGQCDPQAFTRILVAGLPADVMCEAVAELFSPFGTVVNVRLLVGRSASGEKFTG